MVQRDLMSTDKCDFCGSTESVSRVSWWKDADRACEECYRLLLTGTMPLGETQEVEAWSAQGTPRRPITKSQRTRPVAATTLLLIGGIVALTAFMISQDRDSQSPSEASAQLEAPSSTNTAQEFTASGLLPGASPEPFSAGILPPRESGGARSPTDGKAAPQRLPDNCDTSVSDLYCVYEVQVGDTLSSIADLFGLQSTEDFVNWELLVYSNNGVVIDEVAPGLKLTIPRGNGILHTVLTAETLADIADQYGVTVEAIRAVPGNALTDADAIGIGTEILVPNPTRFEPMYLPDNAASMN